MSRPPNRLKFKDPQTPFSEHFDDVYFANEVGVDESIYVYLDGTGALAAMKDGTPRIRIAEVGFGVGLNFILTLRAFLAETKKEQTLHYVSAEKFPIVAEDLITLYEAYPELLPFAKLFLDQYPVLTPGVHRMLFDHGRVILDLMIGDAAELFNQTDFTADFWYWDGFAPSKNPDAFSDALFEAVHKRSSPAARGTSFTAAGWVRKSLAEHGFTVSKRKGFGKKRECIEAVIAAPHPDALPLAWFSREKFSVLSPAYALSGSVAIIGAGLAGSAIARVLADRGYSVEVFDGNGIANRASSNSVALFNVQLSKLPNPISRFSQAALTTFLRELKKLGIPHRKGIFRKDPEAAQCLDSSLYPDSFYEVRDGGVYFPECGMLHPQVLCEQRLNHPKIKLTLEAVSRVEKTETGFELFGETGASLGKAAQVVYALGADLSLNVSKLSSHELLNELPIRPIRGQTLLIKPTPASQSLSEVRVEDGYVSPVTPEVTGHEFHLLGATYQAKDVAENQETLDTEKLITEAKEKWPEFQTLTQENVVSLKSGFRASTPDKLPLMGPLSAFAFSREEYASSLKGGPAGKLKPLEVSAGEWVLMGLGSRGVTFSSLAAEILASLMTGDPLPIEQDLFTHLHPVRFAIRALKKNPTQS